ncbi:hypothetical protein [Paraflavitalea speifideaquila]|uniref:hypothetical protein n=1 Tax=Paraflavitalea speifideaquila TaxID=3076558 RepID=UPI0028E9A71F|nr:hypothetical protein [Paraflavitalea speifideiaquila]
MDNTVKVYEPGSWSRFTTGLYYTNTFQRINLTGSAYYQFGKNANGQKLQGELVSLAGQYTLSKKIQCGPGIRLHQWRQLGQYQPGI